MNKTYFNTRPTDTMPDVQSALDTRRVAIERVGVRGVQHPLLVADTSGSTQNTVAEWALTVSLSAKEKGTHMSRFIALLEKYDTTPMTPMLFRKMASDMLSLLNAERGNISAVFPYFIRKSAPISGVKSLLNYEVQWSAAAQKSRTDFELRVQVPVTSLCPCSKAIASYGAHNQRSHITVTAILNESVNMDSMIRLVEKEASCELWGLLKRPDEKFVTEHAYNNPKFVEDLVRDVAARLRTYSGVFQFQVEAENFESIHNHSAYAAVSGSGCKN